ncbi:hypothetical protein DDF67_02790 [Caulobacter endophyticus]|uniref:Uncharacterized protein n=2 Tax=Caulobacter endophyticus TaxID=2172652 RepID=A0A2T9KCD7_9CAUL|nr:hypothetical protein DDF67_02790 [Caulobacter endophyticus]
MIRDSIQATEKALLMVALGYLEALKGGFIHPDEAFHVIGMPMIAHRMAVFGISNAVADLVSGLDEFEAIRDLGGEAKFRQAIDAGIEACRLQLLARPLKPDRANVCLRLLEA